MTVYIDSLFLTNLFMDLAILFITGLLRRKEIAANRLFIGAAASALYGSLMFFPNLSFMYGAVFKIIFSIPPVVIAFGVRGIRDFLVLWVVFWLTTAACGGIILIMSTATNMGGVLQTMVSNCIVYVRLNPLILIAGCGIVYLLAETYRRICVKNFSREKLLLKLEAKYMGYKFSFTGLIDTGCDLTESLSGAPVIVAERGQFKGIAKSSALISVKTAAGCDRLELIFPEEIICQNSDIEITPDTVIALTDRRFSDYGLYNAVINPAAVEMGNSRENINNTERCRV